MALVITLASGVSFATGQQELLQLGATEVRPLARLRTQILVSVVAPSTVQAILLSNAFTWMERAIVAPANLRPATA